MMKTSAVCLIIWCAQVLPLCALHQSLLTTQELDISTTTAYTTNQDVSLTTNQDLSLTTNQDISLTTNQDISLTTNQDISLTTNQDVSLTTNQDVSLTTNQDVSLTTNQDIRLTTNQDIRLTTHQDVSLTTNQDLSFTTNQDIRLTTHQDVSLTTNQDIRTQTATMPAMTIITSVDELFTDRTLFPTPTLELSGFTSSVEEDRRNNTISTSHHNITSLPETDVSTNNTSVATENQESGTGDESTSINIQEMTEISTAGTSIRLDDDVQTTTSTSLTEERTRYTHEANTITTTTVPLINSTYKTDVTLTSRNYGTTDHQHPVPTSGGTYLEILSTNQTTPDDTTNIDTPTGTSQNINITEMPVCSTQVTSGSTKSTEEPLVPSTLVSSTKIMDWKTEKENTEAFATTRGNIMTNMTWSDEVWSTNTENTWSSNSTTSQNISTSETETPKWTKCFSKDSAKPHHLSKLVCFVTMWALGVTASVFLGLSIFLYVRLSITKKRARLRGQRLKDRKGQGPASKETESLWAEPSSSAEERVEFWYASGAMVEQDKRRHRDRHMRARKNGEIQGGTEEDMWIQPKVTLKDITEFWNANGRVRHAKEIQPEVNGE